MSFTYLKKMPTPEEVKEMLHVPDKIQEIKEPVNIDPKMNASVSLSLHRVAEREEKRQRAKQKEQKKQSQKNQ